MLFANIFWEVNLSLRLFEFAIKKCWIIRTFNQIQVLWLATSYRLATSHRRPIYHADIKHTRFNTSNLMFISTQKTISFKALSRHQSSYLSRILSRIFKCTIFRFNAQRFSDDSWIAKSIEKKLPAFLPRSLASWCLSIFFSAASTSKMKHKRFQSEMMKRDCFEWWWWHWNRANETLP